MIRRLLHLADDRPTTVRYLALLGISALVRATGVVILVPLLTALFSSEPSQSLGWLGLLAVVVAMGWMIDHRLYRAGFDTGAAAQPSTTSVDTAAPTTSQKTTGEPVLEFDRVCFAYREPDLVVDGVSFTVAAGSTTAIVGPSGSGKSTVLALAARLHDVTGGAVSIHGRDVRGFEPGDLAERFAVVHQTVYLFDGTLRDNVRLGNRSASSEELAVAASRAGLDETLLRLPRGWDTRVGESGASLSGGERQRVAIARALVKTAPLLLLDEVTSALDTGNERGIIAALGASAASRATVIVAHRLDTIIGADRIVFLDNGRVMESGRPDELIAAGGRFAEYWHQRQEATEWHLVGGGDSRSRATDSP